MVVGSIKVVGFTTEDCCDYVTIGRYRYNGVSGPEGLKFDVGSTFSWHTDGSIVNNGWEFALPQAFTGSESCQACLKGQYQAFSGAQKCSSCLPGNYQADSGAITCSSCLPGRFTSGFSAVSCEVCSIGHFQPASGASSCPKCTPASYAASPGSSSCLSCPVGFFSTIGARRKAGAHCKPNGRTP